MTVLATRIPVPEPTTPPDALLDEARAALGQEFTDLRCDLRQVRGLVADAMQKLTQGFAGLSQQIRAQDQLIQAMVAAQGGGHTSNRDFFAAFAAETGEVLSALGERIERTGTNSANMAREVEAISGRMRQVSSLVGGVQQISSRIKLVALNAMIEAAHAGDAGRGFSVVATEVKAMGESSANLTEQIMQSVATAEENVAHARDAIGSIAEDDTKFAGEARARVQVMLGEVSTVNALLASQLRQAAEVSRGLLDSASLSITALQFDDMVNQLVGHIDHRLNVLEPLSLELVDGTAETLELTLDAHYERRAAINHKSVEQRVMDSGEPELF
ncbi:MAG: hypothetical protein H7Z40_21340 [Phycisphaerae bacterium]|nr:hypothetical protein [Gemmatimonadaceae bacterium]